MLCHIRVLSCMSVCCETTGSKGWDVSEGEMTLVPSEADVTLSTSVSCTGQYFLSRRTAN